MLKKELEVWLDQLNNVLTPQLIAAGFKPTAVNAREGLANLTKAYVTQIPPVAQVLDDIVEAAPYRVPVRIFNPDPQRALPVMVHFHGGGGTGGSVTVYDPICRKLAVRTQHIVLSAEYRLAPENPYPAGVVDGHNVLKNAYAVLEARNIRHQKKLSLLGDSAGGAMAAAIMADAQFDQTIEVANLVLIYPSLDYTLSLGSIQENAVGYLLQKSKIDWYFDNYFQNNEDRKAASPLYGPITDRMPATQVFTAHYCPLRDEGRAYIERLKEVGVKTEYHELENMIHTFMNMEDLCKAETDFVYEKINQFLNCSE